MNNADMPAMPLDSQAEGDIAQGYRYSHAGLTKREYFAAMAMQGLLSREETGKWADFAKGAVYAPDALIAELERTS